MDMLRKELQEAEIKRHCICIPKDNQYLFPKMGERLVFKDRKSGSVYDAPMKSQYRLTMPTWYSDHKGIQIGDVIIFQKENGGVTVDIEPRIDSDSINPFERRAGRLSVFEGKVLDLIIEAFAEIENRGIDARVIVADNGITVEWGNHIKSTEIILRSTRVTV